MSAAPADADLAVVDADQVAPIDSSTSFTDAAATPLAAGTADEVLTWLALPPGSRLLVLGASGGVGLFLLQLAAARGIETIAVGRSAMHEQMLALGAGCCIDYTIEDVIAAGHPAGAVPLTLSPTWSAGRRPPECWARCGLRARSAPSPPRSLTWARC